MNKFFVTPLALLLLLGAPAARAQAESGTASETTNPPPAVAPPSSPPQTAIPAPPPPPQGPSAAQTPAPAVPDGQWTYTSQYGWLWIPYGQPYTYVYTGSDVSYEYVYYPAFGWCWVSSPWVFGIGPSPYWGVHGRVGFAWYAHPWFQSRFVHRGGGYSHAAPRYSAHASAGFHGGGFHGGGFHGGGHGRR